MPSAACASSSLVNRLEAGLQGDDISGRLTTACVVISHVIIMRGPYGRYSVILYLVIRGRP